MNFQKRRISFLFKILRQLKELPNFWECFLPVADLGFPVGGEGIYPVEGGGVNIQRKHMSKRNNGSRLGGEGV